MASYLLRIPQWRDAAGALGPAAVDPGNPVGLARPIAYHSSHVAMTRACLSGLCRRWLRETEGGGANQVSGYSVIKADSLDVAVALAGRFPILDGNGSIDVCERFDPM
jgi:hypothetical protein